jgi:hypothetical protein
MVKANKFMLVGIATFLMVFSLAFASATTLVAGKIYNSDYTELIEGATVTIVCGPSYTINTESLADGTYAINFITVEGCQLGDKVEVSAFKGSLSGKDTSIIRESQEDGADFVSVSNIGIKSSSSSSGGSGGSKGKGTWFMCGNTVCDSGETHETCASDCPSTVVAVNPTPVEPEETEVLVTEYTGGTNSQTNTANLAGITGAVVGDGKGSRLPIILGSFILLLIIIILAMNIAKSVKKGDGEVPKGNQSKFY